MVVEPALTHGDCAARDVLANRVDVTDGVELRRIVWMNAGGVMNEPRVRSCDHLGAVGRRNRLTDRDDADSTARTGAFDDRIAVTIERQVGKMGVTVYELEHGCEHRREGRGGVGGTSTRSSSLLPSRTWRRSLGRWDLSARGANGRFVRTVRSSAWELMLDPEQQRRRNVNRAERRDENTKRHH